MPWQQLTVRRKEFSKSHEARIGYLHDSPRGSQNKLANRDSPEPQRYEMNTKNRMYNREIRQIHENGKGPLFRSRILRGSRFTL